MRRLAIAAVVLVSVVACSGKSTPHASPSPTPSPTPSASPSPTPSPTPTVLDLSSVIGKSRLNITAKPTTDPTQKQVLEDFAFGWHVYEVGIVTGDVSALSRYFSSTALSNRLRVIREIQDAKQTQSGPMVIHARVISIKGPRASLAFCFDQRDLHYFGPTGKDLGPVDKPVYSAIDTMLKQNGHWIVTRQDDQDVSC